jgi:hypothetical protein
MNNQIYNEINFSPPLLVEQYNVSDEVIVNVVRDDLLIAGTKQRAVLKFIEHHNSYDEFVYAGPSSGFAQVALTVGCLKMGKRITLFIEGSRSGDNHLSLWCEKLGASLHITSGERFDSIEQKAKLYVEKGGGTTFLIPFGLKCPTYTDSLYEELVRIVPPSMNPKRMWIAAGSGTLLRVFSRLWEHTEFYPVQVGRRLQEDQFAPDVWHRMGGQERIDKLKTPQGFYESVGKELLPPYPSASSFDAKVWQHVLKYAQNGDYIWNVASGVEIV